MLTRRWTVLASAVGMASITLGSAPALADSAAPTSSSPLPSNAFQQLTQDLGSAWQISTGRGVTIAVLSSGVESSLPGLAGRVTTGPDYTGSSRPDRISGTLIAANLAGNGDSSDPSQASGLAPGARILSIRTDEDSDEPGYQAFVASAGYDGILARGIRYAVSHGAQVIYVEGADGADRTARLESAVDYALSRGSVIVADDWSDGAEGDASYITPAALPGVIGVAAVNLAGHPAAGRDDGSAQNQSILVAAPGNPSSQPVTEGQGYYIDGSTAAAVWVAGTAALIKSVAPHLSPALVARALALSARDRPAGGYNTALGFGLIDPYQALNEALKLNLAARNQAAAGVTGGSLGQSASATFRSGPALPPIRAVHHAPATLAGYGAAIVAGVLCLIAALTLWWRRRSRRPGPAGSEQLAEAQ